MRWTKFILIFQAIITLLLGMIFFTQFLVLDITKVSKLNIGVLSEDSPTRIDSTSINLKQRYASASYILLFISLMELVIIGKLLT